MAAALSQSPFLPHNRAPSRPGRKAMIDHAEAAGDSGIPTSSPGIRRCHRLRIDRCTGRGSTLSRTAHTDAGWEREPVILKARRRSFALA
jgi:hypothetical protein